MTLHHHFREHARSSEQNVALSYGCESVTYGELWARIQSAVGQLKGLDEKARVGLFLPLELKRVSDLLGVMVTCPCVPLNCDLKKEDLSQQLNLTSVTHLLCYSKEEEALAEQCGLLSVRLGDNSWDEVILPKPENPALILTTSGTSGIAKSVELSHGNLFWANTHIAKSLELVSGDRSLGVMPLYHIHGLSGLFATLSSGGTFVLWPGPDYSRCLNSSGATWYTASPALHSLILDTQKEISQHSLRFTRSASSAMPHNLKESMESALGVPHLEAYGMTEASPLIATNSISTEGRKKGSVGKATGTEVMIGDSGRILAKGPGLVQDGWVDTGDLGYLDEDGFLFVTGRTSDIINRGGEKVSPLEIERCLEGYPAVKRAACFAKPHPVLGEVPAVAVVLHSCTTLEPDEQRTLKQALRSHIARRLAHFKIPHSIEMMDELPLTPSGKLMRKELLSSTGPDSVFVGTSDSTQMLDIWRQVFQKPELQFDHDFFELGGHSLLAARLVNRVNVVFGRELPISAVFERPTARLLGELVSDHISERPLTQRQQSQYFLYLRDGSQPHYHVTASLEFRGRLDRDFLRLSLSEVLAKHSSLRSIVGEKDGRAFQILQAHGEFHFETFDVVEQDFSKYEKEYHSRAFDLHRGPLFRFALARFSENHHVLLMTFHHIIFDGWSRLVLRRDLTEQYELRRRGHTLETLPEVGLPREPRTDLPDTFISRRAAELKNIPFLELATSKSAGAALHQSLGFEFSEHLTQSIHSSSAENRSTPFMTTLTALQIVLSQAAGQQEFLLAVPTANRSTMEQEDLVGFLANVMLLPCHIEPQGSFSQFLELTKSALIKAQEFKDIPLEALLGKLSRPDTQHRSPVQVLFAYQSKPWQETRTLSDGLEIVPREYQAEGSKFVLTLYLEERDGRLVGSWNYDANLLSAPFVEELHAKFHGVLESQACQSSFLDLWSEQVTQRPNAPALVTSELSHTFSEMDRLSTRLAHSLKSQGVRDDDVVAVYLPRTKEYFLAILAIWKCGAAYIPLDVNHPQRRSQEILKLADVSAVVTDEFHSSGLTGPKVILVENLSLSETPLPRASQGLAYIMTTSGSSGMPKGVKIGHANLAYYVKALGSALGLEASDRYVHTAPLTFSSSVRQFALPWSLGATVILAEEEVRRDPERLFALIQQRAATILDLVPSYWRACLDAGISTTSTSLRLLLSASESLNRDLARRCSALAPDAQLFNMYGQTETSGIAFVHEWVDHNQEGLVPIGKPLRGYQVQIREETGELMLEGPGVGEGYCDGTTFNGRYLTGDKVREDRHGNFHYCSRLDQQLKIRGFRVEPAEVEEQLLSHPAIQEVMVLEEDGRLGALLVVNQELELREVREFLVSRLPGHMIPTFVRMAETLPRTDSGKLQRPISKVERSMNEALSTDVVSNLKEIWRQVLGLEQVGIDDNFFDLGGDSLLTIQVVSRARDLEMELDLSQLFQYQTIRLLSQFLLQNRPLKDEVVVRVAPEEIRRACVEMLMASGLLEEGAKVLTEVQLESSLRGQPTHNLGDIPRYAARLEAGILNGNPQMRVLKETAQTASFDGDNGPGQWVATEAMNLAIEKAKISGVGLVLCTGSNHFGAAGHYAWLAAEQGLIGLCTTNGPVILAPTGGVTPLFGNNPIAVGIPHTEGHPLVLDMALSVAPRGKIGLQLRDGKPLRGDWILDALGKPSTDLNDLGAGLGVPIGEHKGYGLALVMEILAGVLSGAGFGKAHSRGEMATSAANIGHFFLVFDPKLYMTKEEFQLRLTDLFTQIKESSRAEGCKEILIPGEQELRVREENLRRGVPIRKSLYDLLRARATKSSAN